MKPIDYRNTTFAVLRERLRGDRLAVLKALREFGPCTTRQLAESMEWDILNVRPRVTELCQLGFAACLDRAGHEGQYRAYGDDEAERFFSQHKDAVCDPQLKLI